MPQDLPHAPPLETIPARTALPVMKMMGTVVGRRLHGTHRGIAAARHDEVEVKADELLRQRGEARLPQLKPRHASMY